MILQRWAGREWVDYKVDGKVVKSPVDIDALPPGGYQLTNPAPWHSLTSYVGVFFIRCLNYIEYSVVMGTPLKVL